MIAVSVLVYAVLGGGGLAWAAIAGRPWLIIHPAPWLSLGPPVSHLTSLFLGVALAVSTVALTKKMVERFSWAAALHKGFRETLGPLSAGTVLVMALTSGIGEELFFRGALQPTIGWMLASLIFGVVHIGPDRRFFPWTIWAIAMGFVLGAIHEATGSLVGPIVAHIWINYENLSFITHYEPGELPTERPNLASRSERR